MNLRDRSRRSPQTCAVKANATEIQYDMRIRNAKSCSACILTNKTLTYQRRQSATYLFLRGPVFGKNSLSSLSQGLGCCSNLFVGMFSRAARASGARFRRGKLPRVGSMSRRSRRRLANLSASSSVALFFGTRPVSQGGTGRANSGVPFCPLSKVE